jgi:hypothetical protein
MRGFQVVAQTIPGALCQSNSQPAIALTNLEPHPVGLATTVKPANHSGYILLQGLPGKLTIFKYWNFKLQSIATAE